MKLVQDGLLIAAVALVGLMVSRKEYTHVHFWTPAHQEFLKSLNSGDLGRAAHFLEQEKKVKNVWLGPLLVY